MLESTFKLLNPPTEQDHFFARERKAIMIRLYYKKVEKEIEHALRNNAVPPVKGEITQGKIKWRGIELIVEQLTQDTWVEQRGVQISNKVRLM